MDQKLFPGIFRNKNFREIPGQDFRGNHPTLYSLYKVVFSLIFQEVRCCRNLRQLASGGGYECKTIEEYEKAKYVVWKGIRLEDSIDEMGKLSTLQAPYIQSIRENIEKHFPETKNGCSQRDIDVFDHRIWFDWTKDEIVNKFKSAVKFLNFEKISKTLPEEYYNLVQMIKTDPVTLCKEEKSSPNLAWTVFLQKYDGKITDELVKIILTAKIIPMGTAQGRSIFFYIFPCFFKEGYTR